MRYIADTEYEKANSTETGGKAKNLLRLKKEGFLVPEFLIIPQQELSRGIPENLVTEAEACFPGVRYFAVRSSAPDEDSDHFSFAGQFESYLYVTKEELAEKVKKVWHSAFSERVKSYRRNNQLPESSGLSVIIQKMADAEVSGVAFGLNPVNGNRQEKLISSVYGLGEGLVSGQLNSDNFILGNGKIQAQIVQKTHRFVLDNRQGSGLKKAEVEKAKQNLPSLHNSHLRELSTILDQLHHLFGKPQDIEFAVREEKIYLLQTRPVTGAPLPAGCSRQVSGKEVRQEGEYILWDNSNIIESYPGVTTPLTFSFISKSYEQAYKTFSSYLGVDDEVIRQNERVFANTLGLINGRVYYNLKSWYQMLAMLPGYSINARFMEKMLGVKERFDIPETYRLSPAKAWWRIGKMATQMYSRYRSLPGRRKAFMELLHQTIGTYKQIDFGIKNAHELMQLYLDFEKTLLNEWKAPLLNDFFAMIWFGLLQKRCEKYGISKNPNIHNDLLCGSSDIISTQPIYRGIALATLISADPELKNMFLSLDENTIWQELSQEQEHSRYTPLKKEIDRYINDFGERCIGELKLESISYTREPARFIKILKAYVEQGLTTASTSGKVEEELRRNAERELSNALKFKPYKRRKLKSTLQKARELVSARENLRFERTRAFGIVREIFTHMGQSFYKGGSIDNPRDIFYLTKEEIFSYIEGTAVSQNIKGLIALRKAEYENYRQQSAPAERFATYGVVYQGNDFFNTGHEAPEGVLKGTGCCPGRVRAKVIVITDPAQASSPGGHILVTSSTDPGWVPLFPGAAGIIVERGSLLSHSAIVSREMGIPCIVSVTGLLKSLTTGDEIEMDGSTGEIKIIRKI